MEEVLSEEEAARHLLALVDAGFAAAWFVYANACVRQGFIADGLRWWVLAGKAGHADALVQLAMAHLDGGGRRGRV